jgi:hypothetical protein
MSCTISATISGVGRAGLVQVGEPDAVAFDQLVLGQAGLAQEAVQRLLRGVGARALQLLVPLLLRLGQPFGHQGQAA